MAADGADVGWSCGKMIYPVDLPSFPASLVRQRAVDGVEDAVEVFAEIGG